MATSLIMVKASDAFKDAIGVYASAHDLTMSDLVRKAVAKEIGYDLSTDDAIDGRGRPRQYVNEKARRRAANVRAREREQTQRQIAEAIMRKERLDSIEALQAWLKARGVSVDDDDTTTNVA